MLYVYLRDISDCSKKEVRSLVDAGGDEEATVRTAVYDESESEIDWKKLDIKSFLNCANALFGQSPLATSHSVLNQVVSGAAEIIETILLVEETTGVVPLFAILPSKI